MKFNIGDKVKIRGTVFNPYSVYVIRWSDERRRVYKLSSEGGYSMSPLVREDDLNPYVAGYEYCHHCGASVPSHSVWSVNDSDSGNSVPLCEDCFNNHTSNCLDCGTRVYTGGEVYDDYYCSYCNCHCGECGDRISRYYYDLYRGLCCHCYNLTPRIQSYNFTPIFTKYGETDDNRFFGIELEFDRGGEIDENYAKIVDFFPDGFTYAMHDGSLNDGFEVATQPATLEFLKGVNFKDAFSKLKDMGYKADSVSTCGLHVHIDVNAFGDNMDIQELRIGRLMYFFSKFCGYITKFSRRREAQLNRYARINGVTPEEERIKQRIKDLKYGGHSTKYNAINLSHERTVEIRVFKGTMNYKTLMATLYFCNYLVDLVFNESLDTIQENDWNYFVEEYFSNNPILKQYLKQKDLDASDGGGSR